MAQEPGSTDMRTAHSQLSPDSVRVYVLSVTIDVYSVYLLLLVASKYALRIVCVLGT